VDEIVSFKRLSAPRLDICVGPVMLGSEVLFEAEQ
jgi:hypothetical protein